MRDCQKLCFQLVQLNLAGKIWKEGAAKADKASDSWLLVATMEGPSGCQCKNDKDIMQCLPFPLSLPLSLYFCRFCHPTGPTLPFCLCPVFFLRQHSASHPAQKTNEAPPSTYMVWPVMYLQANDMPAEKLCMQQAVKLPCQTCESLRCKRLDLIQHITASCRSASNKW